MRVIFKNSDEKEFTIKWNEFIDKNIVSYKYLQDYLRYMTQYSSYIIDDKSFVIVDENRCVSICYLPIENYDGNNFVSLAKNYTISPLSSEKSAQRLSFKIIDDIAKELKISKIKFYLDPLVVQYLDKFNSLKEYGYIDSSSSDCILDLRSPINILWKNLRKSYKSLINGIIKSNEYELVIVDKNNPDYNLHEMYRKMHERCSGRVTRKKETFDTQYKLLLKGNATLIGLNHNGKFIGFNYFFHFKKTLVYASGADDPDYESKKISIYHAILWKSTIHFKEKDFDFIQYSQPSGFNVINGFDDYLDQKQINISHFKRGMGTQMVTLFRGIKYFDNDLFIKDIEFFKNTAINNIEFVKTQNN